MSGSSSKVAAHFLQVPILVAEKGAPQRMQVGAAPKFTPPHFGQSFWIASAT